MTKIIYFGEPNSTFGCAVPLEIFVVTDVITRFLKKLAIYMFKTRGGEVGSKLQNWYVGASLSHFNYIDSR